MALDVVGVSVAALDEIALVLGVVILTLAVSSAGRDVDENEGVGLAVRRVTDPDLIVVMVAGICVHWDQCSAGCH